MGDALYDIGANTAVLTDKLILRQGWRSRSYNNDIAVIQIPCIYNSSTCTYFNNKKLLHFIALFCISVNLSAINEILQRTYIGQYGNLTNFGNVFVEQ